MTFTQQAEMNQLSIKLRDLGIDEDSVYGFPPNSISVNDLIRIVLYTPTNQSHLGDKFSAYGRINNKSIDTLLKSVFSGLGVKGVYLFKTFSSKTREKNELRNIVISNPEPLICLRCNNGVLFSLFCAIRNAIAHGNIIEKAGYYVFYSVSDDKKEYDSEVTFFLRIKKMRNLKSLFKTLEQYR